MTSLKRDSSSSRLDLHIENPPPSPVISSAKRFYGLTFSRGWLVKVAEETVQIANDGYYYNRHNQKVSVKEDLDYSLKNCAHYHSSHTFHPEETLPPEPPFESTEYHVCYGSSLQVAKQLKDQLDLSVSPSGDYHIGILNSASGKRPEKFLRGTLSQEEGICRASLLYPCLLQYYNRPHHFYYVNHKPKYQDSSSSCAIFAPHVPVIREDSMVGTLLDDYDQYSFVCIPAPNAFALGGNSDEEAVVPKAQKPGSSDRAEPYETMSIEQAMHDRIFRALSIFAEQGCTDLVLCAFGCGVHGNDPRMIAECFRDILTNELKGRFRTVAFTIHPSRAQNYEQFVSVFGKEESFEEEKVSDEEKGGW